MKSYVFFFFILFLVSCADLMRPKQIERLAKVESGLLSTKERLYKIDTIRLNDIFLSSSSVDNRIKEYYSGDTISVDFGRQLESYHSLLKNVQQLSKTIKIVKSTINQREDRLFSLTNDVKNGTGNRARYDEYILFEENEVLKVKEIVNYCDSSATVIFETFNILHPKIEQFSLECENNFKTQEDHQ